MKNNFLITTAAALAPLLLAATAFSQAQREQPAAPSARSLETNGVPQSTFSIPASPAQGRDPFYPNAHYLGFGTEVKHAATPTYADTLELKGVSGSADRRLAMISSGGTNRTLAVGEETDFRTTSGRIHVRCVEIKGESAVVEVDGERRELRLRD